MADRKPHWQRYSERRLRRKPAPDNGKLIARINELSQLARTAWFSQLAYFVFISITLLGVEDADFFIPERQTALPLVGVEIPTASFFFSAPVLGAALYAYLHLFLIKLWDAHGLARTGDADPTHHWLVNDFVLIRQGDPTARARPLAWLTTLVTILLVWLAGPFVLAYAWWRSMFAHNEWMTLLIALCLGITLYVGAISWSHAEARLRPSPRFWLRPWHQVEAVIVGAVLLVATSWFTTEGTLAQYARWWLPMTDDRIDAAWWSGTPLPSALARADLHNFDFVDIPDDWRDFNAARKAYRVGWCADHGLPPDACDPAPGGGAASGGLVFRRETWCKDHLPPGDAQQLSGRCAARFEAFETEFAGDWAGERTALLATLTPRTLEARDFRFANLRMARLERANLRMARLERADLLGARLEGADLSWARLEDADLRWARLEWADLRKTRLEGADLKWARLEGANLRQARLEGADLSGARLEGADLWSALFSAQTTFSPATLRGVALREVDFTVLTQLPANFADLLAQAFGDGTVKLPAGLKAGEGKLSHWSTEVLDQATFETLWRAQQAVAGYAAPAYFTSPTD